MDYRHLKTYQRFAACLLASAILSANATTQVTSLPHSGSTTFGDWSFSWKIGNANDEGLVLRNVRWKGTTVLYKVSMPVVRVKYRGNAAHINSGCGPYNDRIHSGNIERFSDQTTDVTARSWNDTLLEIAVFAQIGGYDLYQAYYFHKSGRFEPVLYSSGWSCGASPRIKNDHKHHVYWRLDFDIDGLRNHVRHVREDSTGAMHFAHYPGENGFTAQSNTVSVVWTVTNPTTGKHVQVRSPNNERADGPGSPWFSFGRRDIHVRRYHGGEDEGWVFPATWQLQYYNGENTNNEDVVFWAIGHLGHPWTSADWTNPEWHDRGYIVDVSW